MPLNIYGNKLTNCSGGDTKLPTGFYRDGYCRTGPTDTGRHTVCATMNNRFLTYTKQQGNDLSTPTQNFPGLRPGDNWCICAGRYQEARHQGQAPPVNWQATNQTTLNYPGFTNSQVTTSSSCGNNQQPHIPKNTMSAKQVVVRFLDHLRKGETTTAKTLLVTGSKIANSTLTNLPRKPPITITKIRTQSCQTEMIVTFPRQSTWYITLTRSASSQPGTTTGKYRVPPNSWYWRISDVFKL
jgi:uncharacterized protein (DUF2237 family)